ncbi:hypothetical protein I3843_14G046700 [Carya illinoinensis]|nr:hypothetical protein I3843_14G046700 [Carya illinoinensis]KAG7946582.1 hypothetical protein I3843_14G046700 [Carya illinoinensis]
MSGDEIVERGNYSDNTGQEREVDYATLLKDVRRGDWEATREFLDRHPAASTARITVTGGTVLHAAVEAEQERIVKELVSMISEEDLAMQDSFENTALHDVSINGNHQMAVYLITKKKSLVSRRNTARDLPVTRAMGFGHKELARYLYSQTPFEDLKAEQGRDGASLLIYSIYNRDLDMALDLMECCPHLASAKGRGGISPLEALAVSTDAFESENRLVFWKRWIYNQYRIHNMSLARAAEQFRLNIQNYQEITIGSGIHDNDIISSVGATGSGPGEQYDSAGSLIKLATSRGNFEFVCQILETNPSLLSICDATKGRAVFQWAVVYRQHRICSLAYNSKMRNYLLHAVDNSKNTMLHLAGRLPKYSPIDHIRGAALQMQREVQWFKEVERISPLSDKDYLNIDGLTPNQLFTEEHQNLRKEGEEWMKGTATSYTVVGALIITIMFTAAFTTPGGNDQDTGLPILVHDKLFKLFIVTDSLSLFSATTSVLMFLGILTSRYAEEDFLRSLPRKMIIGLFTLFFSIATMMIAFSAALLLMLHGKYWIVAPIIGLAGIPIILFVLMQFRLLIDMLVSTYGSGIFDRKRKPWF